MQDKNLGLMLQTGQSFISDSLQIKKIEENQEVPEIKVTINQDKLETLPNEEP